MTPLLTCSSRGCKQGAVAWQYSYATVPRVVCGRHARDNENQWTAPFVRKEDKT